MTKVAVVSIGETLGEILPTGEHIGGAPFNVAAHLARLGMRSRLISRIGNDERGETARRCAVRHGVDVSLLQVDPLLPTGVAQVQLDADGEARYKFLTPAAWDAMEATPEAMDAVTKAAVVVYGTLAQRDERSRSAIRELIAAARYRVYDPNLREPHVDRDIALTSLQQADFVKLNEEECDRFGHWIGCGAEPESLHVALRQDFGVRMLCITLGARGALLFHGGHRYEQAIVPSTVVDTVGAGDAFLAMLCAELLGNLVPDIALLRAARLASYVVSRPGAVPRYEPEPFLA
jgi:fructokinase